MFDPERFQLYDASRSLMLAVAPLARSEALALLPGEFAVADRLLAKRLGIEPLTEEMMAERAAEFAALPEEKILRIWVNPVLNSDGCDVFVSPPDALPDVGGAPDWGLSSAGFLLTDIEALSEWIRTTYGVETPEEIRESISRFLSFDLERMVRAVELVDLAQERVLMKWPVLHENPLRAFRAATESYPEVRYAEGDFEFRLKQDVERTGV